MANYNRGGFGFSIPPVIKNLLIINGLVWLAQYCVYRTREFILNNGVLYGVLVSGQF